MESQEGVAVLQRRAQLRAARTALVSLGRHPWLRGLFANLKRVPRVILQAVLTPTRRRQARREAGRAGRYTPRLWPVSLVLVIALITAAAGALGLYAGLHRLAPKSDPLDVVKVSATVAAFVGAVFLGVYAYRRQRLAEGDARRADAEQLGERYSQAAEQLGHEKAAVRLAGVFAMARLADDWAEERSTCIDVLCAYLRMPYEPDPDSSTHVPGEREVRRSIVQVIRDRLRDPASPVTWCGRDLDFTGAVFDSGSFEGAHFTRGAISFVRTQFPGGGLSFKRATFSGAEVSFAHARFTGGRVMFDHARFSGSHVIFGAARFDGGTVSFDEAEISGGMVSFMLAEFGGAEVKFTGTPTPFGEGLRFSDGLVDFGRAKFSRGRVKFTGAEFCGAEVEFRDAQFTGSKVTFDYAVFSGGRVRFGSFLAPSRFSGGDMTFQCAGVIGGLVQFEGIELRGTRLSFADINIVADTSIRIGHLEGDDGEVDWGPLPPPIVNSR